MLVVAADDPWMPQAAEHLAALDALGIRHGVLVVTRVDLADPAPALARARAEVDRTSLAGCPGVVVSGRTGAGLDDLRAALGEMLRRRRDYPGPTSGSGSTGSSPSGAGHGRDRHAPGRRDPDRRRPRPRTRAGAGPRDRVIGPRGRRAEGPARVALRLGGRPRGVSRGSALVSPGAFADVTSGRAAPGAERLPERPLLHLGREVAVRARMLGERHARLRLRSPLPLRHGDRLVLRDPGSRRCGVPTSWTPTPRPWPGAERLASAPCAGLLATRPGRRARAPRRRSA